MYGGYTLFVHYCGNNLSLKSYVLPSNPATSKCIFLLLFISKYISRLMRRYEKSSARL